VLDVLLINPGDISPYPAMGLAELAAFVRQYGYSVKIIDFSVPNITKADVVKTGAKIVGISVPCGLIRRAFELAEYIKEKTEAIIVFGGYYPTFCWNKCLEHRSVDFVVIGEGEIPLLGLLDYLIKGKGNLLQIPGIAFRGQIKPNPRAYCPTLDSLPIPAFDLLPLSDYPRKTESRFIATLSTGRGCPFGCKFCSQSAFWEQKVRFKSPEKVLQIVDELKKTYPINYIRILDDIFPLRPQEALEIAQGLKERDLTWECQARIDTVSEDLLQKFAKTGLDRIFFGIESGSPKIQKFLGKEFEPSMIKRKIAVARQEGIKTKVSFQIGTPGETRKDVNMSINLANTLDVDEIALFISTPFPGTPLHKIAVERKLIKSIHPDDYDPSIASMSTGYLSVKEVEEEAERFLETVKTASWGHHSEKGRKLRKLY